MATKRGQDFLVEVTADPTGATPVYTKVGLMTNATLNSSFEMTDGNNFDSPDWAKGLPALKNWSVSNGTFSDPTDAGQKIVHDAHFSNALIGVRLAPVVDKQVAGDYEYVGSCYVSEFELGAQLNENATMSTTLTGDGPLTPTELAP